jgi:hypothetical protein
LDRTISKRELCDYYDLSETTFEGVDFDRFMFYLDANYNEIADVWIMYFKFDNGDVIKLIGNSKEDSYETIPNDPADFSHYVRLLAENNI